MSTIGGPDIITDGLVLALDAANIKSYPGSGTVWSDLSGFGNDFTIYNGASTTDGNMVFDGVNDYAESSVNFINDGIIGVGNIGYTIEAVVRVENTPGSTTSGYSIIGNAAATGIGLQLMNNGGIKVNFGYRTNSNFYSTSNIALNTWVHIIATKIAAGPSYIYINGELDATFTTTTNLDIDNTTAKMQIGYAATRITGRYNGKIGLVKLYKKSLDESSVLQNYNAVKSRFGL